jgi:hypothetical protein
LRAVALVPFVLAACSGSGAGSDLSGSSFVPGDDGGLSSGDGGGSSGSFPPNLTDASVDAGSADSGPVSCTASRPANFSPVWSPPNRQTDCLAAELSGYYDACAPNPKAPECTTWLDAHVKCAACIEKQDNSGPVQIYLSRKVFTLNVAGCISLVENVDTCAQPYDAYFQCRRQSCEQCFSVKGATYDDFTKCQTAASSTECKSYQDAEQKACADVKTATGAPSCFPTAAEAAALNSGVLARAKDAQRSLFIRVEGIFCGP